MEEQKKNEAQDPVQMYLDEIHKFPPMTPEEKQDMIRRLRAGDEKAAGYLAGYYAEMVVPIAREYEGRGLAVLDLIQEGNNGLFMAAKRFSWEEKEDFTVYAEEWIHRFIRRALEEICVDRRFPEEKIRLVNLAVRTQRELEQRLGRAPTPEEVARAAGKPDEEVPKLTPVRSTVLEPRASQPDSSGTDRLRELYESGKEILSEREQNILFLRLGLDRGKPRTLEETARITGISQNRVRLTENKVMRRINQKQRAQKRRDFFT